MILLFSGTPFTIAEVYVKSSFAGKLTDAFSKIIPLLSSTLIVTPPTSVFARNFAEN